MFNNEHGYSLVELLVTFSLAALTYVWSVPILGDWFENYQIRQQYFSLNRALIIARQHAISSGSYVAICPLDSANRCTSQWNNELTVFENKNNNSQLDLDEAVVHKLRAVKKREGLRSFNGLKIAFNGQGFSGFGNGSLSFCLNGRRISKGAVFIISRSGRVRTQMRLDQSARLPSLASGQSMPCQ